MRPQRFCAFVSAVAVGNRQHFRRDMVCFDSNVQHLDLNTRRRGARDDVWRLASGFRRCLVSLPHISISPLD
jgi:hypothetical protein